MIDPNGTDRSDGVAVPGALEGLETTSVNVREEQVASAALAAIAVVAATEAAQAAQGAQAGEVTEGAEVTESAEAGAPEAPTEPAPGPLATPDDGSDFGSGGAYAHWKASDERTNARENRRHCLLIGLVLLAIALTIAATAVSRSAGGSYRFHAVPLAGAAALGALGAFLAIYSWIHYASVKNDFLDDYRRERVYDAIKGIRPTDVRQLIILNQRRMDQYHQMTLAQAADAWRSSQLAMTVGLVVLVTGITVAVAGATATASEVVIGSLTAMGSAISGYVAATFLRARRQSLRQLNFYFHQPLATSYLLTAERLTEKIHDPVVKIEVWKTLAAQIAVRAFDVGTDLAPAPAGAPTPAGHDHGQHK